MKQLTLFVLIVSALAVRSIARADSSCDSTFASDLARQGYHYLDSQKWTDALTAANQLLLYAKGCNDAKVGMPSVVYSAYIGSAALHGMGDDTRAAQAAQAGMAALAVMHKSGDYGALYDAMEPKFEALTHEFKPSTTTATPPSSVDQLIH
jgi:hypothetical protein